MTTPEDRRLGFENFILLCDRAYNAERVENFHIPLRMMGVQPVFDYKKNNFGLQSIYKDVILVDGTWYVTYMPQSDIDAMKNYRNGLPDPETKQLLDKEMLKKRIASRESYRMIPKGRPDADGYQRLSYPKPGYMAIDRATGKRVKPKTAASITIPLLAGLSEGREKDRQKPAIKHWQKFPYKSEEHKRWYGMRSLVESSNKTLKSKRFEDMRNTGKRTGRGFTFHNLVTTLMVVSANIRKIVAFFLKDAVRTAGAPLTRVRRRKNPNGARLEKHATEQAAAPLQ